MAETSVKITLELADRAAQAALSNFISKSDSADKSLKNLKHSGESTFSEIAVHLGKATGAYDIFVGNITANLAIAAFELMAESAHKLFDVFVVEGVHAAAEEQAALNSLNVALAQAGQYSKETSESFEAFANQLAKTTTFQDGVIIKNAALIESLGQLDEEGLKRATKAALDLAAGLDKDIGTASEALGKAAAGNTSALTKMGFQFQKGRTDAETFANALTAIEEKLGGAAESKVNTYSGAVTQAANSFEKLIEEIGSLIVKNPAVIATLGELGTILSELSDSTKNQNSVFVKLVGEGLSTFLTISASVVTAVDALARVFQFLYGVAQSVSVVFGVITVPLRALSVGIVQASKEFQEFGDSALKNLKAFGKEGDGALSVVAEDLLRLRDASNAGLVALANGADGTVAPLNNARGAMSGLTEEQKNAQERLKSFTDELVKQSESSKASSEQQLAILQAQTDAAIAHEQNLVEMKFQTQVDYLNRKAEIEAAYDEQRRAIEDQKLADDMARLQAGRDQNLSTDTELIKAKQALQSAYSANREKEELEYQKKDKKLKAQLFTEEELLQRKKVQAVSDALGNLSVLMQTNSRELFEIGKAAAIASATINTYQAITKAYADLGPIFGLIAGTAIGIAGFVQVSNISRQNPSFEQGGIVPGTSFSGDNVLANVNSGEMILNRQQQSNLFSMVNGGGNSGVDVAAIARAVAREIAGQAIVVNVGGKAVVDTLRSELAGGRTFSPA